ncbi:hypothetical protein FLM48_17125 [Shewanella sp. Scap07]|uniref:hypothetical protein n=1 Tax=Shewanella sp. Scap07 TaxID=2589987 RepID=UPI0015C086B1|nr:hypothetical protein [Shewanella sp. Scap07]QLE86642.1 hypothetical protein FLM48_17125 [Shewanella sp. Scap07]
MKLLNNKKAHALFAILLLTLFIFGYCYALNDEIAMLARAKEQAALLRIRPLLPPLFSMMPALIILIWGLIQRINNTHSACKQKRQILLIGLCLPLYILTATIYNLQITGWLTTKGYTQCHWYSGTSFGAATIMVNNTQLCIPDGYQVRTELLEWFETQYQTGVSPTPSQAASQQQQLQKRYDIVL